LRTLWLIARRAAVESLRDRMTIAISLLFSIGLPILIVQTVVRFQVALSAPGRSGARAGAGDLLPAAGARPDLGRGGDRLRAVRGEKELGSLAPLLASPASNGAIFGGKILAAVLPALLFAIVAEVTFLINLLALIGWRGCGCCRRSVAGAAGAGAGGGNLHRDDRQPRLVARADVQHRAADQRAGAGPIHGSAGDPGVPAAARRHARIGRGGRRGLRARRAADRGGGADLAARGGAGGA
jgi:hypothetical protein